MSDLLFSTPWWLPTAMIAVGIALFISGNARQRSQIRNGGAGLIALAVVLILVSYFVETAKEKIARESRELVRAVEARDWAKMKSLLDLKSSLGIESMTIYGNRDDVVKGTQSAADQYGLKSVHITSLEADQTQTVITVNLDVLTEQDFSMGRPIPSSWQFEWEKLGENWTLYRITCLRIGGENGDQAKARFPK